MHAAIHPTADITAVNAECSLFAEAHHLDLMFGHTGTDQLGLDRFCPLKAEREVIACGALLIRITLDQHPQILIALEKRCVFLQLFLASSLKPFRPTSK